jgi:hypothetical protein
MCWRSTGDASLESRRWRAIFQPGIIDSMGFLGWNNNRICEKLKIINIYIYRYILIYILHMIIFVSWMLLNMFHSKTMCTYIYKQSHRFCFLLSHQMFHFSFGTCPVTCFQISHDLLGWNVEQSPFCYGKSPCYSWEDSLFHGLFNSLPWKMTHL